MPTILSQKQRYQYSYFNVGNHSPIQQSLPQIKNMKEMPSTLHEEAALTLKPETNKSYFEEQQQLPYINQNFAKSEKYSSPSIVSKYGGSQVVMDRRNQEVDLEEIVGRERKKQELREALKEQMQWKQTQKDREKERKRQEDELMLRDYSKYNKYGKMSGSPAPQDPDQSFPTNYPSPPRQVQN